MRHDLRRLLGLVAAGVASLAVAAPPATAAASVRTTVFASRLWKLGAITMDGSNVAVVRGATLEVFPPHQRPSFRFCGEVDLVNVASRRLVRLSLRSRGLYCADNYFGGYLALAGRRAYWVYNLSGNFLYQSLFTGAPGSAQRTLVDHTFPGVYPELGPYIGPLAASGATFAYSQWRRVGLPPGCDFSGNVGPECTSVSAPQDFTLTLQGSLVALPAPGGLVASVDDAGRAAVMLASEGRVAIVARNAQTTITTPIPGVSGRVADAALAGRWLVALAGKRIWAFDSQNGHLRASWPAQGATHVDVWNGIAVFATRRQVIAVRLANGHRQVIQQLNRGRTFVDAAQIEASGIVWATRPVRDVDNHGLNAIYRVPVPHLH